MTNELLVILIRRTVNVMVILDSVEHVLSLMKVFCINNIFKVTFEMNSKEKDTPYFIHYIIYLQVIEIHNMLHSFLKHIKYSQPS
jgi:hypothetical protein